MIKILFAHQDPKLSQIYTRPIQNHFAVDLVGDGLTALRKIRIIRPAIVISDYQLPILSGLALLRFMRSNEDYWATPFVFLSDHEDNREALSHGANDWLEIKSTHPDFLLNRIYHHLKTNKHAIQIH